MRRSAIRYTTSRPDRSEVANPHRCAWDTLFLPAILQTTAHVASTDPHAGQPVQLTVTPTAVLVDEEVDVSTEAAAHVSRACLAVVGDNE